MKLKDIIQKLQELNSDDFVVEMQVEPIINCIEQLDGIGWETTRYRYTIILESKDITRKYKNKHGIKEYLETKGE